MNKQETIEDYQRLRGTVETQANEIVSLKMNAEILECEINDQKKAFLEFEDPRVQRLREENDKLAYDRDNWKSHAEDRGVLLKELTEVLESIKTDEPAPAIIYKDNQRLRDKVSAMVAALEIAPEATDLEAGQLKLIVEAVVKQAKNEQRLRDALEAIIGRVATLTGARSLAEKALEGEGKPLCQHNDFKHLTESDFYEGTPLCSDCGISYQALKEGDGE